MRAELTQPDSVTSVQYLSDEWIAAADLAVRSIEAIDDSVSVGFIVTDGPDGERSYTLRLGPDTVGISTHDEPNVTLRLPWAVAVAIAKGEANAQRAVLDGQIRIGGDIRVLLGNAGSLGTIDDHLVDLRAITEF